MNKEEILEKAKKEKQDEMVIQVRDKSITWTYIAMVLSAAVFAEIRASKGQPMMDLCVTVCVSVAVGQLYRYVKTKEKYCLLLGLITFFVGIAALVRFFQGH